MAFQGLCKISMNFKTFPVLEIIFQNVMTFLGFSMTVETLLSLTGTAVAAAAAICWAACKLCRFWMVMGAWTTWPPCKIRGAAPVLWKKDNNQSFTHSQMAYHSQSLASEKVLYLIVLTSAYKRTIFCGTVPFVYQTTNIILLGRKLHGGFILWEKKGKYVGDNTRQKGHNTATYTRKLSSLTWQRNLTKDDSNFLTLIAIGSLR